MSREQSRKAAQAADEAWQQLVLGRNGLVVPNSTVAGQSSSATQNQDEGDEVTTGPSRKSRLSAVQLQAQVSRMLDRTRLRRLKVMLRSKGALHKCAGFEDLCRTHFSHKWLFRRDACAGKVLAPHDIVANAQERLGKRAFTGEGRCRLCGAFLDLQLEHAETCSTAEATQGHCACVHAVVDGPGITTEPRGPTEAQSRPDDILTTAAVPRRSAAPDVRVPFSNAAAARGDAALAMLQRRAAMSRTVLPNTSARDQWLLAGLIDRATSHWARAPPLDGGDEDYFDDGTDTSALGDHGDDLVSIMSQQTVAQFKLGKRGGNQ